VKADHLGLRGVDTLEELARVKRVVIEVAMDVAVLNADDALCLKMADHTEAERVCYVTINPGHPLVKEHIRAGGYAVVLEVGINGQMITLYDRGAHLPLLWTHQIPATLDGRAMHNVQNAMFAAAMAYAMKVRLEDIRHGLQTFDTTWFQAPGRMNIYHDHPFKVILDYGHNPAAVEAMVDVVGRLDVKARRIVVLAAPGDRRDEDMREIGRLCAGKFDRYICRRDDRLRGRDADEVPRILRDALIEFGVDAESVEMIPDEKESVDAALRMARKDDLLLVFGDDIERTWNQITSFESGEGGGAADSADTRPELPELNVDPKLPENMDLGDAELISDERGVRLARESED
jgi:cyanophycin synthetase